jgi:hypothetical protein
LGNDFNEPYLAARLKGRKTPIKAALLDQHIVAGLGNIYVAETLYRARISPLRLAGDLDGTAGPRPCPGDPRRAGRGDRGGRVQLARLPAGQWRAWLFLQAHLQVYDREGSPAKPRAVRHRSPAPCNPAGPPSGAPPARGDLPSAAFGARSPRDCHREAAMAYETLIVEIEDYVSLIRLNRPDAMNALNTR